MAKKVQQERLPCEYKIDAKFADYILCPSNAIDPEFYHRTQYIIPRLRTRDGVLANPVFECSWNNAGGVYDEEIDGVCMSKFRVHFMSIRSMWVSRLASKPGDCWHLIKMEKLND